MSVRDHIVVIVCILASIICLAILDKWEYLSLMVVAIILPLIMIAAYAIYHFRESLRKSPNLFLLLSAVLLLLFFLFNIPIIQLIIYYFNYAQGLGQPLIYSQIPIVVSFVNQFYYAAIDILLVVLSFASLAMFFYHNNKAKRRAEPHPASEQAMASEPSIGGTQ